MPELGHALERGLRRARRARGEAAHLDPAGPGDLGEQAGRCHHVSDEVDAIAAIDGRPIAPGLAGMIERTGSAFHYLAPVPSLTLTPVRQRRIEQVLQSQRRLVGALARANRHLRLHQLLAVWGQGRIGGAEALDPAGLIEVGNDEGIATAMLESEVDTDSVPRRPLERLVAEQLSRLVKLGGNDR